MRRGRTRCGRVGRGRSQRGFVACPRVSGVHAVAPSYRTCARRHVPPELPRQMEGIQGGGGPASRGPLVMSGCPMLTPSWTRRSQPASVPTNLVAGAVQQDVKPIVQAPTPPPHPRRHLSPLPEGLRRATRAETAADRSERSCSGRRRADWRPAASASIRPIAVAPDRDDSGKRMVRHRDRGDRRRPLKSAAARQHDRNGRGSEGP